ncbi:hypothetical protein BAE44_0024547 [Dichanthelium oligosanthes]|uniref:Myb/SANT-like domain-containing protein n=1 Tax=Dichanthelium oligosanthes TaxID=888268 RepID=A0A1E5UNG5_9POAL|nr:hypothetical protein BAE44_0024547 [Dichanthelium oligosanthes]
MSTESTRATWNYTYEKGLADIMKELVNLPMLRGQNGWTAEGWRNITKKFNAMFPLAHFMKQQIQKKEKELKGYYKIIREARKSGVGFNDTLGMIIAELKIWDKLIEDNSKVSKLRKKAFPLFNNLESLYEGNAFFFLFVYINGHKCYSFTWVWWVLKEFLTALLMELDLCTVLSRYDAITFLLMMKFSAGSHSSL